MWNERIESMTAKRQSIPRSQNSAKIFTAKFSPRRGFRLYVYRTRKRLHRFILFVRRFNKIFRVRGTRARDSPSKRRACNACPNGEQNYTTPSGCVAGEKGEGYIGNKRQLDCGRLSWRKMRERGRVFCAGYYMSRPGERNKRVSRAQSAEEFH